MHVIADAKLNIRSSVLQIEKYVLPPFTKEYTCGISKTNYQVERKLYSLHTGLLGK